MVRLKSAKFCHLFLMPCFQKLYFEKLSPLNTNSFRLLKKNGNNNELSTGYYQQATLIEMSLCDSLPPKIMPKSKIAAMILSDHYCKNGCSKGKSNPQLPLKNSDQWYKPLSKKAPSCKDTMDIYPLNTTLIRNYGLCIPGNRAYKSFRSTHVKFCPCLC